MKYKAALFDMDGVILDSEPLHVAAFQATLDRHGYKLSTKDYKEHFAGKTDEAGFESYFNFINETVEIPVIMGEKARKYLELAGDQLVPYTGIVPLIRNLADIIPLALVTGSLRAEAEVALKAFEITDCFKVIIAAEDISQSKPNPEGYNKAAARIGVSLEKCVVIEDSPSGIKAALAAGIECIAVTNTHTKEDLSHATIVVDKLELSMF
jgi:beta-phosphoglucomutase